MELKRAQREAVKLKIGLSGASGFGKTYSALLLAFGITNDWSKIAVIDTENGSASLYAHLGNYNTISLAPPFSPERYVDAIKTCEMAGIEVIIVDSITHEWSGSGGCLEIHEKLGGRFQDWAKVTPRHQAFIDKILESSCHIITTTRRKVDYSMDVDGSGKTRVVKHGTKEITREGFEYELTVNFELVNDNHLARASKDRTGLFMNRPEFVINASTGNKLKKWCGGITNDLIGVQKEIANSKTVKELRKVYQKYPEHQAVLSQDFITRKSQLMEMYEPIKNSEVIINAKTSQNGSESTQPEPRK